MFNLNWDNMITTNTSWFTLTLCKIGYVDVVEPCLPPFYGKLQSLFSLILNYRHKSKNFYSPLSRVLLWPQPYTTQSYCIVIRAFYKSKTKTVFAHYFLFLPIWPTLYIHQHVRLPVFWRHLLVKNCTDALSCAEKYARKEIQQIHLDAVSSLKLF